MLKGACLLRLDGNGSFSAQSLKDFCGALGPRRLSCLEFFEQPLKVGEEEASYDILEAVGCPLALDESLSSAPAKLRGWAEAFSFRFVGGEGELVASACFGKLLAASFA